MPTAPKMLQNPPQRGDAQELRPTIFVAAPAVLDKVFVAVNAKFDALSGFLKRAAMAGLERGKARFAQNKYGTTGFFAGLVFSKVRKLLGGNIQLMLTGSAPLSVDVQIFMQSVFGCPVRQGYGLTETCAATTITLAEDNSTACVGPPQASACIRLRDWAEGGYLASDEHNKMIGMRRGEVLIGGPTVAQGYLVDESNPEAEIVQKNTEDFVTIDGIRYFCTGDIGQFTPSGNLMIIDRKKDLVKLQQVAASLGVDASGDLASLCKAPKLVNAVAQEAMAVCQTGKLAKFEIPTKFILVDELWTPDNGMLTAVNKLKRKEIVAKHHAEIEGVYV